MTTFVCAGTGKTVEARTDRLPRGWKRLGDATYSPEGWRERYVLRAVTLPVVSPVDATWEEFRNALRTAWADTTAVANWAVRELLKADVVRTPDLEKLPPMPSLYLYPGAREIAPDLSTQSVVSTLQAVEQKYRAARYDMIWRRATSPPSYRYPTPYPVHNQAWKALVGPDGEALVSFPMGGRRWTLRLRGGPQFRRQLGQHRQIASAEALRGELAIYQRDGLVMAKLVAWLPRTERKGRSEGCTMVVRTSEGALLLYQVEGDRERKSVQDQVRRWTAEHRRRLQGLSDDRKREKRVPAERLRAMQEQSDAWVRKHRRRIDTVLHQVTAEVAGVAERRGVTRAELDIEDRGYVESFPWHRLVERLKWKLDEAGVVVVDASGDVVEDSLASLEVIA